MAYLFVLGPIVDWLRFVLEWGRDISVSIVTRLRPGWPGYDSRQELFIYSCDRIQTGSGAHLVSYAMEIGNFPPRIKRTGDEADRQHLVPRLRKCGAIPPLPNTSSWRGNYLSTRTALPLILS